MSTRLVPNYADIKRDIILHTNQYKHSEEKNDMFECYQSIELLFNYFNNRVSVIENKLQILQRKTNDLDIKIQLVKQ